MVDEQAPDGWFERLQKICRVLLLIYIPGILFAGAVLVGAFAYGLAHASGGAASAFLAGTGLAMLLALGLPLLLLLPGKSPGMKALKSFAMLVLAVGLGVVGKAVWYATIEPAIMTARFNHAMDGLSIAGVSEQPLRIDGKVVGLRLGIDVRLSRALEMSPQGNRALEFMQRPEVLLARVHDGSRESALQGRAMARISLGGRPLESGPVLPAGVYHVERDLLLAGLDRDAGGEVCRLDSALTDVWLKRLETANGREAIAVLGVRMALRDRLGYRYFQRESEPLEFRYDAARWKQDLALLPVELCSVMEQRHEAAAKAKARARFEVLYAAGDPSLGERDNPLYQDMCAEDLAPLRRRLEAGAPPYRMSGKLIECGIVRPRPELFAMLMPVLHGQVEQTMDYCDVVRFLHSRRAIPFLEQLEALRLPMACGGERRLDWREGIRPADANGNIVEFPSDEESLRWLQVAVRGGVPVCEPIPREGTLLSRYVNLGPPQLIELLLKAGCDPGLRPARDGILGSLLPGAYSPQVWWAVRRHMRAPRENVALPVDAAFGPAIDRMMGEPSAVELNEPDPMSGRAFLHEYGGIAINEPDLMVYLLSRGIRVDAAEHSLRLGWYSPGYHRSDNNQLREKPMLDRLSREQLRQLIAPRDTLDGSPGRPMEETSDFSDAGLGRYLCTRGVLPCPESGSMEAGR